MVHKGLEEGRESIICEDEEIIVILEKGIGILVVGGDCEGKISYGCYCLGDGVVAYGCDLQGNDGDMVIISVEATGLFVRIPGFWIVGIMCVYLGIGLEIIVGEGLIRENEWLC